VFDGTYKGGAPAVANCRSTTVEVDVLQGKVGGIEGTDQPQRWRVQGTVSAEGSFTGQQGDVILTGKFHDGTFEGTYLSSAPQCGRRTLTLQRDVPR
jgi:hypothetical protein